MTVLRIHDLVEGRYVLAVDLHHLLDLLGTRALHSMWEVDAVDDELMIAGEEAADELEEIAAWKGRVSGVLLSRLAHAVHQVIWGEFRGLEEQSAQTWVIIRAIDSTCYEVETEDVSILTLVRETFKDVREASQ